MAYVYFILLLRAFTPVRGPLAIDDTHRPIESSEQVIVNVWNEFLDIFISANGLCPINTRTLSTTRNLLRRRFGEYVSELTTEPCTKSAIGCNQIFYLPKPLLLFAYRGFALVQRIRHMTVGTHRRMRHVRLSIGLLFGGARAENSQRLHKTSGTPWRSCVTRRVMVVKP